MVDALKKWPGSEEPNETVCITAQWPLSHTTVYVCTTVLTLLSQGYCLANDTSDSIYTFLGAHPERAGRFGNAMVAYARKPEHDPAFITDYYDWAFLGTTRVIHVGGGSGHYAMALAKKHTNLQLVVQDLEFMMGPGEAGVPE